jgi:peptide/nickel transport system permease protein
MSLLEQTTPTAEAVLTPDADLVATGPFARAAGWSRRGGLRQEIFRPNKIMLGTALLVLVIVALWAIFPSLFTSGSPTGIAPLATLHSPSWSFPMGTDQYGRSVYTEVVYGAREALEIGFFSTLIAAILGSAIGLISGYFGGVVDLILMRVIDMLMAIPSLLLALIFVAALSPSVTNLILAIAVASLPHYARVLRGQSQQVRSRLYIDAATVLGVPRWKIIGRHVIPNCLAPVLVLGAIGFGTAIVVGAALAFLGLGPTNSVLNWGALINSGQQYVDRDWWITTFPGIVLTLVVIAVNIVGDWIRDRMEPSSR